VIRKIECGKIFPSTPPQAFDFEYNNEAIYQMDITWVAEDVKDLVIDSKIV
jgi:hypothetical protein